jgi:hypothetical protein
MNTSKLWSALVVCCIACGSSFHSNDASTGGDGNGGSGGTDVSSGGDTSSAGTSTGGKTGTGGHGHGGSTSTAGSTSAGGVIGVGGDVSIAGSVSAGGVIGVGGNVGVAGGFTGGSTGISGGPSGGAAGSNPAGGSGGSGATDCTTSGMLWTTYMDLVDKSVLCDAALMGQCVATSNIVSYGNCPIPVNQKSQYYSAAKNALQNWKNAGCTFKISMCLAQGSPTCQLGTDTAATCKSNPIVTQ